jgi:hypothetical protein
MKKKKHFTMYYLVIQNLGVERCIHQSDEDVYIDGMAFSCTLDLGFFPNKFLRDLSIVCIEVPDGPLKAKVYSD